MPLFGKSKSMTAGGGGKRGKAQQRHSIAVMSHVKPPESVMRVVTLDESLHTKDISRKGKKAAKEGSSTNNIKRSLSYSEVQIREYERVVGDNPSVSSGPPISIGWKYNPDLMTFPLEKYEKGRPNRRSMREMALPRKVREEILKKEWGIPQTELAAAVRSTIKVKNQRRATVNNLGKADKAEEMMESAGRKMKLFAKSTDKKTEQLMAAAKNANANSASRKADGSTSTEGSQTPEETPEPVSSKMNKITISEDDGEDCAA